jgi:Large polyvalent protein-associated domain 1
MSSNRPFYRYNSASSSTQPLTNNQSVSFVDVRSRFDFRSISIGRWVTESERDRAAGLFYHALVDLMEILQGPESLISLRGTLSFQYGIGGRPGASAHYLPGSRTFSLAKNAGPGSIAHEWFHALDHYLGTKAFSDTDSTVFASEAWLKDATPIAHPINDRLFSCFRAIMLDAEGIEPSELFLQSAKTDNEHSICYYSKPEELCARAFEAFVQDAHISNNFLVAGTKVSEEAKMGLYPQGEQRLRINAAFREYFSVLGYTLGQEMLKR